MTASRPRARARKAPSPGRGDCACGRVGDTYALVLCQDHAPIPYELTDKGRREAQRMTQWDAVKGSLVEATAAREAINKAARADGRKIAARVRREARSGRARVVPASPAPESAAGAEAAS